MADENLDKGQLGGGNPIPQVPTGFRLVTDDAYKKNAEAANDLKKLKANVPDGFDISKLKDLLTSIQKAKDADKSDLEKLTQKMETLTSGNQTSADAIITLKEENRILQIDKIVNGLIAEKAAQGNYLAHEFVDSAALAALDPGDGEKFLEKAHKILAVAWTRQEEVASRMGSGRVENTPATGVAAGGAGGGQGMKSVADLQNEQLEIMADLQTKGRLGGRVVETDTKNK